MNSIELTSAAETGTFTLTTLGVPPVSTVAVTVSPCEVLHPLVLYVAVATPLILVAFESITANPDSTQPDVNSTSSGVTIGFPLLSKIETVITVVAPAANGTYSPSIGLPDASSLLYRPLVISTLSSAVAISNAFERVTDFAVTDTSPAPLFAPGCSFKTAKP